MNVVERLSALCSATGYPCFNEQLARPVFLLIINRTATRRPIQGRNIYALKSTAQLSTIFAAETVQTYPTWVDHNLSHFFG